MIVYMKTCFVVSYFVIFVYRFIKVRQTEEKKIRQTGLLNLI